MNPKKYTFVAAIAAAFMSPAMAQQEQAATIIVEPPPAAAKIDLPATEKTGRVLSPRERVMADAQKRWEESGQADALVGPGGDLQLAYGYSRPTVRCAPLQVCTIRLIPGENIVSIALGDTVRWHAQQTTAGDIPVILVKPTQPGLTTNLVVTTDQARIYYLHLLSEKREYMPMVSFYDPEATLKQATFEQRQIERLKKKVEAAEAAAREAREAAEKARAEHKARTVVAEAPTDDFDPTKLDFGYRCTAEKRDAREFLPVRVFSNKTHTFVQMPPDLSDWPAIFKKADDIRQLANARRSGQYFVVDGRPAEITLVRNVGLNASVVNCVRAEKGGVSINWRTEND